MPKRSIVLLRGVNVGGHNSVPMAELRSALAHLGTDVATYIQSGNIALSSDDAIDPADIKRVLVDTFDVDVPVIVLDQLAVARIAAGNPFTDRVDQLAKLYVFFLDRSVDATRVELAYPERFAPDEAVVANDAVYVHYVNGAGRSMLTLPVIEKALGVVATGRNMKTVRKLIDL